MIEDESLALGILEEPVRARDVAPDSEVRPRFSSEYWTVLTVEPLPGPYVRILWEMRSGAPEPSTVFEGAEWLATR
jgi:hypothetical protein